MSTLTALPSRPLKDPTAAQRILSTMVPSQPQTTAPVIPASAAGIPVFLHFPSHRSLLSLLSSPLEWCERWIGELGGRPVRRCDRRSGCRHRGLDCRGHHGRRCGRNVARTISESRSAPALAPDPSSASPAPRSPPPVRTHAHSHRQKNSHYPQSPHLTAPPRPALLPPFSLLSPSSPSPPSRHGVDTCADQVDTFACRVDTFGSNWRKKWTHFAEEWTHLGRIGGKSEHIRPKTEHIAESSLNTWQGPATPSNAAQPTPQHHPENCPATPYLDVRNHPVYNPRPHPWPASRSFSVTWSSPASHTSFTACCRASSFQRPHPPPAPALTAPREPSRRPAPSPTPLAPTHPAATPAPSPPPVAPRARQFDPKKIRPNCRSAARPPLGVGLPSDSSPLHPPTTPRRECPPRPPAPVPAAGRSAIRPPSVVPGFRRHERPRGPARWERRQTGMGSPAGGRRGWRRR